jgi:hypothetical protein
MNSRQSAWTTAEAVRQGVEALRQEVFSSYYTSTASASWTSASWGWHEPPRRSQPRPANPHLAVLGLSEGATREQIRQAYRRRARETHPDMGGSAEEFRRVQTAWDALR